jgi:hypothetical protein
LVVEGAKELLCRPWPPRDGEDSREADIRAVMSRLTYDQIVDEGSRSGLEDTELW